MPTKPIYKPKMKLITRLEKEEELASRDSRKVLIGLKKNDPKIESKKEFRINNEAGKFIEEHIYKNSKFAKERLHNKKLRENLLTKLTEISQLAGEGHYISKGTLNQISLLNNGIYLYIKEGIQSTNAPYFQKIEKEYTKLFVNNVRKIIDHKMNTDEFYDELNTLASKLEKSNERQSKRYK